MRNRRYPPNPQRDTEKVKRAIRRRVAECPTVATDAKRIKTVEKDPSCF